MGASIDMLINPARRTLGYAKKLAEGIAPGSAARFPRFGERVVTTNHPTFVYGHLSIYPARVMTATGCDAAATAAATAPAHWPDLFKAGVECKDDPAGTIYPAFPEVFQRYVSGYEAAFDALSQLSDPVLLRPHPDEKVRETFPTIGMAMTFLLNNHVMMHLGQVSAWRRCVGLPSAM